jgi:hypothetical protein
MLDLLPSLCIIAGLGLAHWACGMRDAMRSAGARGRVLAATAAVALGLWCARPLGRSDGDPNGVWGFGGMRRVHVARAAEFIRQHTAPNERICAPDVVALQAQRIDPFHYRELLGVCRWAEKSVGELGWHETQLIGRHGPLHELEADCRRYWMPQLFESIRTRAFAAVVPDTDLSHFAILLPEAIRPELVRAGYVDAFQAGPLTVWLRPKRAGEGVAAPGQP